MNRFVEEFVEENALFIGVGAAVILTILLAFWR